MENPYITTYSPVVHTNADPVIDRLSEILQGGSRIVFAAQPTEYHDRDSSRGNSSHHQLTEFQDGDYVHPSSHHSPMHMLK